MKMPDRIIWAIKALYKDGFVTISFIGKGGIISPFAWGFGRDAQFRALFSL